LSRGSNRVSRATAAQRLAAGTYLGSKAQR
jgi:hypothetical protein